MRPDDYTSHAVFERERERIFGRLWLFAGLEMMVARPNAYYARRLAGVPILLQNTEGTIGAYVNACAHRGALVQEEGIGVRPAVCAYHGWRYAADGSVDRIPFEEKHYRFTPEQRACLRLQPLALQRIGQFLFVNFAPSPMPIEAQYDARVLADLAAFSAFMDTDVAAYTVTSRYNWKLASENLRDMLHPQFVHPKSLNPVFEFAMDAIAPPRDEGPMLPTASFGGAEGSPKRDLGWPWWNQLERWPAATEHYYNWLLFPNVHIASPDGCRTFGIEQYDPVAPDSTRLHHFMLTAKRREPIPHGHAILRGMVRSARVVLDEDARIMELAQAGAVGGAPAYAHGAYEGHVQRFERVYRELLDG